MGLGSVVGILRGHGWVVVDLVVASCVSCRDRRVYLPSCHGGGGEDGGHGEDADGADGGGVDGGDVEVNEDVDEQVDVDVDADGGDPGAGADGDGFPTCPRKHCPAL
jgi:hypothetical protein